MPDQSCRRRGTGAFSVGLANLYPDELCAKLGEMDRLVSQKAPWLAQTKFHIPQIRDDSIARQRLSAWLAESVASTPITLVSAPAGYGKTTLLATLQNSLDGERRIAWLSLDEEEDDLNAFLLALIGALQTLDSRCGAQALDLLPLLVKPGSLSDSRVEVRRFLGILINEIQENLYEPFVLILDDVHFITSPLTLAALDYLLERMPGGMHIVLATRRDPPLSLPRYRARRRLAELRLTDLRFTVAETGDLLNGALGLDVAADSVETLQARTEGWAAGLSLLANSLERMPPGERALFIEQLARMHQETFDYLSDEVLRRQPEDLQTFLLQTSILHALTPQQCTAVTGIPHTADILEDFYRRNVFILAVDSEDHDGVASLTTYRHHALLADFLRHRLIRELPHQAPELHRRAAVAQSSPARAIHHYAEAQMWDEAAAVIDAAGLEMIRQGRLDPLSGWISLLPEATRLAHPRLAYLMGLCELQKGEPAAADRWLGEALDQAQISGNSRIQGAALAALGSVNFVQFEQTLEFVSQALTYPVSPYVQVQALMARASVALFSGDWVGAAADLERALQIVESMDGQEALLALMLFLGQEFNLLPGKLRRIESFCTRIEGDLGEQIRPVRLGLEDVLAFVHLRRGNLRAAIAAGERAITVKEQLGGYYPFLGLNAAITVATAQAALGEYATAGRYLSLVASAVSALPLNQHTVANGLFPQARTYWLQGRDEDVKAVYAKMCALAVGDESPQAEVLRNVVASFLTISEAKYETAVASLIQAEKLAELAPLSAVYVYPPIIRAYALLRAQQVDAALEVFGPILVSCEEADTPGIILQEGRTAVALLQLAVDAGVQADYAGRLLAQLQPEPTAEDEPALPDDYAPLTDREIEVLRLIAAGASNKAIAEELVISMPTVKSHVSHILSKLNVSSRGQAGARARELDLV